MAILYNVWLDRNKFTYLLDEHRVARVWADIMKPLSVTSLYKGADHWHGRPEDLNKRIGEFNFLIDQINTWIPKKIPGHFDPDNAQASLNLLHISFPEQHYKETDPDHQAQLRYYNHLLHQIEKSLDSISEPLENISIAATPEIPSKVVPLEEDDYKLFRKTFVFGDLLLHYPHVGRHPYEITTRNDRDCPSDQIICQSTITESHSMRFGVSHMSDKQFNDFYQDSGIAWPYAVDDPKLAVGYIRLGRLISVNYEPVLKQRVLEIVKASTRITNWQIFDQNQQAEDSDDTN
jgi:hypothetical protein